MQGLCDIHKERGKAVLNQYLPPSFPWQRVICLVVINKQDVDCGVALHSTLCDLVGRKYAHTLPTSSRATLLVWQDLLSDALQPCLYDIGEDLPHHIQQTDYLSIVTL